MDAQHRHELKENDLAESLRNLGVFWQNWGNSLLLAILIVLLVILVSQFVRNRAHRLHEEAWGGLVHETDPAGLRLLAQDTSNPAVQALARLQAGELLLLKTAQPGSATQPSAAGDVQEAQDLFQSVVDQPGINPVYRLNALLGLAAVAENQAQWDRAAKYYQQVAGEADDKYSAIASRATQRLELLQTIEHPVTFAPSTQPTFPAPPEPIGVPVPVAPEPAQ